MSHRLTERTIDSEAALRALVGEPTAIVCAKISDRINATFQGGLRGGLATRLAHTADNLSISLRVPAQYRYNLPAKQRVPVAPVK